MVLDIDRYGRYLATVHTNDEDMVKVNSYGGARGDVGLISEPLRGLAWHYVIILSQLRAFVQLEIYASTNKLGLWSVTLTLLQLGYIVDKNKLSSAHESVVTIVEPLELGSLVGICPLALSCLAFPV